MSTPTTIRSASAGPIPTGLGGAARSPRAEPDLWSVAAHIGFALFTVSMILPAADSVASSLRHPRLGWEAAWFALVGVGDYVRGTSNSAADVTACLMATAANALVPLAYGLFLVRRGRRLAPWAWGVGVAVSAVAAVLAAGSVLPPLYTMPTVTLLPGYLVWTTGAACLAAGWTYARRMPVWRDPRRRGFAVLTRDVTPPAEPALDDPASTRTADRVAPTRPSWHGMVAPVAAVVTALFAIGVGPFVPDIQLALVAAPPSSTTAPPPPPALAFPTYRWPTAPLVVPPPARPKRRGQAENIQLGSGYVLRGSAAAPGGFTLWNFDVMVCPNVSCDALPLVTPDGAVWFTDDANRRLLRYHRKPGAEVGPPDAGVPKQRTPNGPRVTTRPLRRAGPADVLHSIQLHPWREGWLVVRLAPPGAAGPGTEELVDWQTGAGENEPAPTPPADKAPATRAPREL